MKIQLILGKNSYGNAEPNITLKQKIRKQILKDFSKVLKNFFV